MDKGIGSAGKGTDPSSEALRDGRAAYAAVDGSWRRSLPRESVVLTSSQTDVVEAAVVSSS